MTADATGFWSYVHKDDQAEKGRIEQLARDLVDQYEMTAQKAQFLATTLGEFSQGLAKSEALSRDLRPPLQTMKRGVAIVMEASSLADGWLKAIEESPVDCTDQKRN
jgi:hypothetical protein